MATAPAMPAPIPEPTALSEGARLVNVFVAPTRTFTDLRRSASWWAPFVLLSVMSLAFVYTVDQKIGFRKVAENQIQASPKAAQRIEQLPAAQRDQTLQRQTTFFRDFSYAYPTVILVWNIVIAAILFATFKFAASSDVKFKTSLAIVMYASLPLLVKTLLATISVAAGASADSFTFQNPVATNPGYFLTPADSPFLYNLATAIDIFMIWTLIVTAIGFTCVSKVKRSTALAIVFGWYFVFALGGAGFGAMFS